MYDLMSTTQHTYVTLIICLEIFSMMNLKKKNHMPWNFVWFILMYFTVEGQLH